MNILILGSGGRESTFAWKISQSPLCNNLFIAPGNAGTSAYGKNVTLKVTDFEEIGEFVLPYEAVRQSADPTATLLEFLESTYAAAADLGKWDRGALER